MRVLIVGCGYLGCRLGAGWVAAGHRVAGVRRPGSDPSPLRSAGIEALHADLARREDLDGLPGDWDWVVNCAAPSEGGEEAYRRVYFEGMRNLVDWLRARPPRMFVFTGSTGVYPQNDGGDVDETSSTDGGTPTGRVLREAEEVLLGAAAEGFPGVVLRISGIYGPSRNRIAGYLRGDAAMTGDGSRWMNMVHLDDLVAAIGGALERGKRGAIYNVSDGASCTEREFYAWLGTRLGKTAPVGDSGGAGVRRARGVANRRIVADRIRRELGWNPRYPDFRAGYEAEIVALGLGGRTGESGGAG